MGNLSDPGVSMMLGGIRGVGAVIDRESVETGLHLRWLIAIAIAVHLATTLAGVNPWHPDEHFQILEFAFARAELASTELLPWEFHQRIRSTLQPTLAMLPLLLLRGAGIDSPFVWVALLEVLTLAAAGGITLWIAMRTAPGLSRPGRRMLWLASLFIWFLPFLRFRYTGENLGGMALAAAVPLIMAAVERNDRRHAAGAGVLLGLSVVFRFQMAFAAVALIAWAALNTKARWRLVGALVTAAAFIVVAASSVDAWFYGEWVFTPWQYFRANIVEGAAATFGTSPWHWYLTRLPLWMAPPLGPVLMVLFVVPLWRHRGSPWVWLSVAFLIGHSLVGHKELRFLFPLIYATPILLALSAASLHSWMSHARWRPILIGALGVQNLVLLLLMTTPLVHRSTDVDRHYLRFLWDRGEDAGGEPVYVVYGGPAPYQLWDLSMESFRHPSVREIALPAGQLLGDLVPPDTPPDRLLYLTTDRTPPEIPDASALFLVYQAEPGYAPLGRTLGGTGRDWANALSQVDGWADSDWVRSVYEVRLGGS